MRSLSFSLVVALVTLVACGGTTSSSPSGPAGSADAAPESGAITDASVPSSDASPNFTPAACDGGSPATDGGACDPTRLRVVHRSVQGCFAVGQFCDAILVGVPAADQPKLPPGFTCSYELGVASCNWPVTNHMADGAAVDAACAVTQALPGVTVDCVIYD